jgi:SAM-dependent methyltransferase
LSYQIGDGMPDRGDLSKAESVNPVYRGQFRYTVCQTNADLNDLRNVRNMLKAIIRPIFQAITGTRKFYYRKLHEMAPSAAGKRVLEIGSGKQVNGKEAYSAVHIFKDVAEFRQTDLNPEYGHESLDITDMDITAAYDVILCLNVLEHVYDFQTAVKNLRAALVDGGQLVLAVPFAFPLHDEPHDYYRYTEFALRRMLSDFRKVDVTCNGLTKMPYGIFVIAEK